VVPTFRKARKLGQPISFWGRKKSKTSPAPKGEPARGVSSQLHVTRRHSAQPVTTPARPAPSKCASISSSVLPLVSGRKNAAVMK